MDTIDTKELIESIKEIELYLKKLEKLESENKWYYERWITKNCGK